MIFLQNLNRQINSLIKANFVLSRRWTSSHKPIIEKLLIANRGEIACRITRTARRMGIKTVAVYSEADSNSMHVQMANEAFCIGPPASQLSYLRGEEIIRVAKQTRCQAIHPGYGFLSENAEFAEHCQREGIVFIGPPASAIRSMGIKSTSKQIMADANVPIIRGYHGENQNDDVLKREAAKIGYPLMIKAVRGGGGKGMRIAMTEADFDEALSSARSESQKSFGDSVVLLESFVQEPRHVEVQVFADTFGETVYLYERDCSVQRRHQKIIEEAPAPGIDDTTRKNLGMAAVRAAKAVGYVGAGTVEFIFDRATQKFYFMEMNTRLQVEHPITEMITGTDLVEWQIRVAEGKPLPLAQEDIQLNGHSFETRIYAENPEENFLPGAGHLEYMVPPAACENFRLETGVRQGDDVSVYYDPMIAKLVVWGHDRIEALNSLKFKLAEFHIAGLETNLNFLLSLANHPEFAKGNVHTNFIRDNHESLFKNQQLPPKQVQLQAVLAVALTDNCEDNKKDPYNPFTLEGPFRVNYQHEKTISLQYKNLDITFKLKWNEDKTISISLDGGKTWSNASVDSTPEIKDPSNFACKIDNSFYDIQFYRNTEMITLFNEDGKYEFELEKPKFLTEQEDSPKASSQNTAVAPMPGVIEKLLVKTGDFVKAGDPVVVLIAMKMEFIVKATRDAEISNILYKVGDNVPKGAIMVEFKR